MSILVLQPRMTIRKAGEFTRGVGVNVRIGASVSVVGAMFVLLGRKVGVVVMVAIAGVADAPMMTGVGL